MEKTHLWFRVSGNRFFLLWNAKSRSVQRSESILPSQKKVLQIVNTSEAQPPYVLGNFPKAEVQFMCLEPNDSELARPKLKKEADSALKS